MGIYRYRSFNYQRPNRFDVIKTNAENLGDKTKTTRFGIIVETNKKRPRAKDQENVLVASKRTITNIETGEIKENVLKNVKKRETRSFSRFNKLANQQFLSKIRITPQQR